MIYYIFYSLQNGIQLMVEFGICYLMRSTKDAIPMYLFPSLCPYMGIFSNSIGVFFVNNYLHTELFKFTILSKPHDEFCGVQIAAPQQLIFIPGFVCQFFVEVLASLNVCATLFLVLSYLSFLISNYRPNIKIFK